MDDACGIGLHHDFRCGHGRLCTTAHDRQSAILGPRLSAGHWCIHAMDAPAFAFHEQLPGDPRGNGGVIDEQASRLHRAERAFAAQRHLAQVVISANATDYDLRLLRRFGRAGRDGPAIGFGPAFGFANGAVVNGQVVSGLGQMSCNRAAHDAQADKRDVSHMPRRISAWRPAIGAVFRQCQFLPPQFCVRARPYEYACQDRERAAAAHHRR